MSQLLINKLKNVAGLCAMLTVFFMAGTVDAVAQQRASNDANPNSVMATKLGVTACPMGSATNVQGGLATIESQAATLRQLIKSGNGSVNDKLKYFYYESILQDVGQHSVAPELSLLTSLREAAKQSGANNVQMLRDLYNATKVLFGMC